ncbi:hypothetical protein Cgig2_001146 [Carnegiea gigantea]|uniref:Uncharacterized protein n=1 Tax=Carnegiea gigantea TaxID=171969 RepID=A0A9Q1K431_9CARY|nr:hypothetical protein Cgig2_001146 [Carnegiea gigantea]
MLFTDNGGGGTDGRSITLVTETDNKNDDDEMQYKSDDDDKDDDDEDIDDEEDRVEDYEHSTSFMHSPLVDACMGNPFLDPNQVLRLNQDAGLQASHAEDTSGAGGVNTAFWNTFGSFMPYNANLIMSVLGSMQQSQPLLWPTPQPPVEPTPQPPVEPTPQRTPEPHA